MRHLSIFLILFFASVVWGCSGSTYDPVSPDGVSPRDAASGPSHGLLGLFRFEADPDAGTLDFIPLRNAEFHLNALPFLEPPPLVNLTLESPPVFNGNILDVDIGLRHPFLGLTEFTGFDVGGILISHGSVGGFTDPDLLLPGPGDLRLLNADGLSFWWNPVHFPVNTGTMFAYNDGLLGTPHGSAGFDATLNGYKYFADGLNPNDPVENLDLAGRGKFAAGQKNIRHYTIDMGNTGLIFNYAVDASWEFPQGGPPWQAPDDFPPGANRPEPWNITVQVIENSLWNDGVDSGGNFEVSIYVYDWFNGPQDLVTVESDSFDPVVEISPVGGGPGYSTYVVEIIDAMPPVGSTDVLITAACEVSGYGGLVPAKTQAAYRMFTFPVDDQAPPPPATDPPEWSCFQYNSANIGQNPNPQAFDPSNYSQVWYTPDSGLKYSGPAVTETHVYVATNIGFYSNPAYHRLTCFNINDGSIAWQNYINPTGDYARSHTSPAWFDDGGDGRVVIGGDRVWCFDALTGAIEWEYGTTYKFIGASPKIADGKVFIAGNQTGVPGSGVIHCIDAYTGAQVWLSESYSGGNESTPAVVDGKVYVGAGDRYYCIDATDGSTIWKRASGMPGTSHWDAPLILNGRLYYASYNQKLTCLDITDGSTIWTYTEAVSSPWITALTYWTDPADGKTVVYFGGAFTSGGVWAIKDNGASPSLLWKSFNFYCDASPVLNDGVIYAGNVTGNTLYGFNAGTGTPVMSQSMSGNVRGAVAFAFDKLIATSTNGVYCFQ